MRAAALFLLLTCLLLTGGCWDEREVETLGLVDGLALDRGGGGQIRLTLQILNSRAMSHAAGMGPVQGVKTYQNFTAQARTTDDALARLTRLTPRRPFFSSLRLVAISEDLARERDLREILDFLTRDREIRRDAWFVVSRSPINRLFDVNTPMSVSASSQVQDIMNQSHLSGLYTATRLADVVKAVTAEGVSPTAAGLTVTPNAFEPPPDMEARHVTLPEPQQTILMSGTAVFKNGLLTGWLDSQATNGLLWVQGKRGGTVEVPAAGGQTTLKVINSRSAVRMEKTGGLPEIYLRIEAACAVGETDSAIDLTRETVYRDLGKRAADVVREEVAAAIAAALTSYRADIFGFSQVVHRADPKLWATLKDTWSDRLPELPVSVEVHVRVTTAGLVSRPLLHRQ